MTEGESDCDALSALKNQLRDLEYVLSTGQTASDTKGQGGAQQG